MFKERLSVETQKLRRVVHNQESEIETLFKFSEKALKEKNEALNHLENTKKYIGSIVTTSDLKERLSKEFKMIREMTETIISKDTEISELKSDIRRTQVDMSSSRKHLSMQEDTIERQSASMQTMAALLQHLAGVVSYRHVRDMIHEFINRLSVGNDAAVWFDKIVDCIAALKVLPHHAGVLPTREVRHARGVRQS